MWLLVVAALAQPAPPPRTDGSSEAFTGGLRVESQQTAVLGAWSVANVAAGSVGYALADSSQGKAFHVTNAAWNVANLGIAGAGALSVRSRRRGPVPSPEAVARQHRDLRRVLAVNLALDGVYTAAGAGLWAAGGDVQGVDLQGVGQAIVLQGAFLAVFDAVFLLRHRAGGSRRPPAR